MIDSQSALALDSQAHRLWFAWIAMWSGETDASTIVSAEFQIRFAGDLPGADGIRRPTAFQSFVTASRAKPDVPTFVSAGSPVIDKA